MILEKRRTLKPLIESSGGVHFTAYLKNTGDLQHLKAQIQAAITKTEIEIETVMTPFDRRMFLAPLRLLMTNDKLLKSIKHNIGIFRTSKDFRVLALPIDVDAGCVVATSFHVKPLLLWMRVDQEFLLLGCEKNAMHLYAGTQHSMQLVETFETPEIPVSIDLVSDWLRKHTRLTKPKLFLAGDGQVVQALKKEIFYPKSKIHLISESFHPAQLPALCFEIRSQLESEAISDLEKIVTEFRCAENRRVAERNIFQIAKAVAQCRVRKLMVIDGVKIFGRFNPQTGALVVHPRDLDHEDDDILDDLAQSVLAKGGKVVVTSKQDIPEGNVAWAILEHSSSDLSRAVAVNHKSRLLEQRVAV